MIQIYEVIWVDPASIDSWTSREDLESYALNQIISVGMLVKKTKDSIVLTLNWDRTQDECSVSMIIPTRAILKIRVVGNVQEIK